VNVPHTWDPDRYLAYADERGRPFVDLISRIDADVPQTVVDLGCGPGNLTA
jgi:trans-aconitate 2-methyltransferase